MQHLILLFQLVVRLFCPINIVEDLCKANWRPDQTLAGVF